MNINKVEYKVTKGEWEVEMDKLVNRYLPPSFQEIVMFAKRAGCTQASELWITWEQVQHEWARRKTHIPNY